MSFPYVPERTVGRLPDSLKQKDLASETLIVEGHPVLVNPSHSCVSQLQEKSSRSTSIQVLEDGAVEAQSDVNKQKQNLTTLTS